MKILCLLLLLSLAPAVKFDSHPVAKDKKAICAQMLPPLIDKWQKELRLTDWRITPICGIPPGLVNHLGLTEFDTHTREATVYINEEIVTQYDKIVLHELLHLLIENAVVARSSLINEQTVRTLTESIYKASKEKN